MMKKLYYFSSGPRERVLKKILEHGWQVEALFLTCLDKSPCLEGTFAMAREYDLPVNIINKQDLRSVYLDLDASIPCFSLGFKYLFPPEFIDYFSLVLNVHGTLLPYYSGARTLNWIIENGERFSGVTVHKVDYGMDTGPILLQEEFLISPFDTGSSLYRKTLEFEPKVVAKCLRKMEEKNLEFNEQKRIGVKQYPDREPQHSQLDITQPLELLLNKIKAADPDKYPAYFYYNGEKVAVKLFRVEKPEDEKDMV